MLRRSHILIYLISCLFLSVDIAHASIQVIGTRVIYPANEKEVTVNLVNNNDTPRLLQAWVDTGNIRDTAETASSNFIVNPPMARINPGKGQSLRLIARNTNFPQDRETIYWLNILEIPPRPTNKEKQGDSKNFIQFAVRTRIKILYRPQGLKGSAAEAYQEVSWQLVEKDQKKFIRCKNPTDFNVSLSRVELKSTANNKSVMGGGVCPAKGEADFPVTLGASRENKVVFSVIDDFGGLNDHEAELKI